MVCCVHLIQTAEGLVSLLRLLALIHSLFFYLLFYSKIIFLSIQIVKKIKIFFLKCEGRRI